MECWTVIVISILILMLLNVYFWLYCLFCKRTKRCGDIEYFITVVHKNKNSDNRKQLFPMDVYTSESHSSQGSDNANDENSWEYMCNRPLPTIPEESESLAAAEEEEPTPEPTTRQQYYRNSSRHSSSSSSSSTNTTTTTFLNR